MKEEEAIVVLGGRGTSLHMDTSLVYYNGTGKQSNCHTKAMQLAVKCQLEVFSFRLFHISTLSKPSSGGVLVQGRH